jgi:hypothetical protein
MKAGFISQREPEKLRTAEKLEPQQKRTKFEVSPAPEGAPDKTTNKRQKRTTMNKRKQLTSTQAPTLIPQLTGAPNPQLQLR